MAGSGTVDVFKINQAGTEASAMLEVSLPTAQAHTVGGMVISFLRHIPHKGESVIQAGYRFLVEEVKERGIQKLRVTHTG